jgi:tetratricopeptide (TPR) repeat protein
MATHDTISSPALEYERLLLQLAHLMAEGRGDTEEADALRDQMDRPWRELRPEEMGRLRALSADLYMLQDAEIPEPLDPAEGAPERLGAALQHAYDQQDWDRLLALLRKGPSLLPPDRIASLRARAYQALGHPETALLFLAHAARLAPEEERYHWGVMALLLKLGRVEEALAHANAQLERGEAGAELAVGARAGNQVVT